MGELYLRLNALFAVSKSMRSAKPLSQNPPVLNWGCQLTRLTCIVASAFLLLLLLLLLLIMHYIRICKHMLYIQTPILCLGIVKPMKCYFLVLLFWILLKLWIVMYLLVLSIVKIVDFAIVHYRSGAMTRWVMILNSAFKTLFSTALTRRCL